MPGEWNRVTRRQSLDAGGKDVDQLTPPRLGIMLAYSADRAPSRGQFLDLVLLRMALAGE